MIYHPEPKYVEKKSKRYFSLGHRPHLGQPGWPSGPEWTIKENGGLWGIKNHYNHPEPEQDAKKYLLAGGFFSVDS